MEELIVEILAEVKKMREKMPEDTKISVSDILLMIDKAGDERKIRAKIKEKVEMDSRIEDVYNEASKIRPKENTISLGETNNGAKSFIDAARLQPSQWAVFGNIIIRKQDIVRISDIDINEDKNTARAVVKCADGSHLRVEIDLKNSDYTCLSPLEAVTEALLVG